MRIATPIAIFGAAFIAATLAPSTGFAGSSFPPGAEAKIQGPQARATSAHKLVNTTIDYGNLATSEPTGYTLIDSNTVSCTKPTCSIAIDMEEQVGNANTTGNWFAVCALVDGNFAPYGCPYAGEVPADYSYVDSRTRQTFAVSKGSHTVQVYLYLGAAAAYSDAYDIQYGVLTP